jgi:hypothetical protein
MSTPPISDGTRTATGAAGAGNATRSGADRFMRQLLRLPEGKTSTAAEARSAFQKSLLFTTCRCLLMYIILPFVLPAVGIARGVGPVVGFVIGILAIVSIVYSIRRFWRADHSKRWHYTVFGGVIIGFLVYLTIKDVVTVAT